MDNLLSFQAGRLAIPPRGKVLSVALLNQGVTSVKPGGAGPVHRGRSGAQRLTGCAHHSRPPCQPAPQKQPGQALHKRSRAPLQQAVGSSDNAKRLQRKHAEFTLELAEGRADLYPETPVTAQGYKPEIDATPWIIDAVIHQFTDSGYTCEIKMQTR